MVTFSKYFKLFIGLKKKFTSLLIKSFYLVKKLKNVIQSSSQSQKLL